MAMQPEDGRVVTDVTAGLGVLVTVLSVSHALWSGEPRFLLGAVLGSVWIVLGVSGWGR